MRTAARGRRGSLLRIGILTSALCAAVFAQPPVAPTGEALPGNESAGGTYSVRQSFEAGYRWDTVGGSDEMYRSTVNYGNGIRLLSSSLNVQSREGHGRFFDQIQLDTLGLGNDPYESAILRIEKNRWYRYDLAWRSIDYFNPALTIAGGEHFQNTVRHLQDHDFTLFPQSSFKLFLGYSRNTQDGPGLSTIQLFDSRGDEFPLFANINREQDEKRLGGEARIYGFVFNVLHGWVDFKEDSPVQLSAHGEGNNPEDFTTLDSFQRTQPYHGSSPYWRGALFRNTSKWWSANARMTYVGSRRGFVLDELANGTNRIGIPVQRQAISFGDATRPSAAGNATFSLFPASRVTITNQTSFYQVRMQGNNYFVQADNGAAPQPVLAFEFLGIRTIANNTDALVRASDWLTVHGGYLFSTRRIQSDQGNEALGGPAPSTSPVEQNNNLHAGTLGLAIRPVKPFVIDLEGEIGRADHPIYPISDRNYQAFRGRAEYRRRTWRMQVYARTNYNTNSDSLAAYASKARVYGVDGSVSLKTWLALDAGYSKQHLDTLGTIAYFAASGRQTQLAADQSYYLSNLHTATLMARFEIRHRADVSAGYSHIQDVGGPSLSPVGTLPAFLAAQTFPLRFHSPMARVSILITPKLRWNAGYQYYGYRQEFAALQNYRANTGYSSVSWSF
jgi:hypothetical protein